MAARKKHYWLIKSEPYEFSIDDLKNSKDGTTSWDGVRNYQARNIMRDEMKIGDKILFYHSNAKPPGVIGIATVASKPYADFTQFDKKSKYFDPKATQENPRWQMVDIKYESQFKDIVSLDELKETKGLEAMKVVQKGQRLSVQPVEKAEFDIVVKLGKKKKAPKD